MQIKNQEKGKAHAAILDTLQSFILEEHFMKV